MTSLENIIHTANIRFINIDAQRQPYTKHFDKLCQEYFSHLKMDETMSKLLKGTQLGGSYGDRLKVKCPDEFDLVFNIVFPESDKIIIKPDPKLPGNVSLNMTNVLSIMANQPHNNAIYTRLKTWVSPENMLLEDKLQSWLQGLSSRAISAMESKIEVDGVVSNLTYKRCGPAHTIYVNGPYTYSVDFVPGIRIDANKNVLAPEQAKYFKNIPYWNVIPKPMKPAKPNNISFRASYYEAEKALLKNKNNLKTALKVIKRFRDSKQNMSNLKSYYIKTLFLWEVTRRPENYWNSSLNIILIDMLEELRKCFMQSGKLLFFWHPKLDMLATLDRNQKSEIYKCINSASYIWRNADGYLTEENAIKLMNTLNEPTHREPRNAATGPDQSPLTPSKQTDSDYQCLIA